MTNKVRMRLGRHPSLDSWLWSGDQFVGFSWKRQAKPASMEDAGSSRGEIPRGEALSIEWIPGPTSAQSHGHLGSKRARDRRLTIEGDRRLRRTPGLRGFQKFPNYLLDGAASPLLIRLSE